MHYLVSYMRVISAICSAGCSKENVGLSGKRGNGVCVWQTFPFKQLKATKRPLVSTDCNVQKSVWSTVRNFMNGWEGVVDAVLYVNMLWQIKSLRIASDNKD